MVLQTHVYQCASPCPIRRAVPRRRRTPTNVKYGEVIGRRSYRPLEFGSPAAVARSERELFYRQCLDRQLASGPQLRRTLPLYLLRKTQCAFTCRIDCFRRERCIITVSLLNFNVIAFLEEIPSMHSRVAEHSIEAGSRQSERPAAQRRSLRALLVLSTIGRLSTQPWRGGERI